jgi:hypothetical protein
MNVDCASVRECPLRRSRGDIVVTTPNEGVIKLAERLEERGVRVIPE